MKKNNKIILVAVVLVLIVLFLVYRGSNLKKLEENKNSQTPTGQNQDVACTEEYSPVCGEDDNTYSNKCVAEEQNDIKVKYSGVCRDDEISINTGAENIGEGNLGDTQENQNEGALTGTTENPSGVSEQTGAISSQDGITLSGVLDQSGVTLSGALSETGTVNGEKVLNYFNSNFGYGFSIPANSYYSGFGAREGASHSVGINSGRDITDFDSSDVKVFFYKGKIINELKDSRYGFYTSGNKTYLKVGEDSSIVIENLGNQQKIVDMIVKTVYVK